MATIRASCDHCGDVELTTTDVDAWTRADADDTYSFVCPHCRELNIKGTDRRTINLLIASGVRCVEIGRPSARAVHPASGLPLAPLAPMDLDDFCAFLADDGAFNEALVGLLTS